MGEALASGWRGGVGLAYRWGRDFVGPAGEWVVWVWFLVDGDDLAGWFFILGRCDGVGKGSESNRIRVFLDQKFK